MGIASLSSHGRIISDIKNSFVARLTTAAGKTDISVHLVGGLQAGQTRSLKVPSMIIGGQGGADVVLLDEGVANRHAKVQFSKSAFGALALVEAIDAPIEVDGTVVRPGERLADVKLPFKLAAGSAEMIFDRPTALSTGQIPIANQLPRHRPSGIFDPMILLAIMGLLLLIMMGIVWHLLNDRSTFVVDINTPVQSQFAPQIPDDVEWLATTRGQIRTLGLENILRVNMLSDSILRTSGQIPEAQLPLYREFQAWYDGQTGAPSMIWEVSQTTRLARLPNIGMVRFSSPPGVVLTTGSVVAIGEELVDGWVLSGVDGNSLTLKRGLETQLVDFRIGSE